MSPDLILSSPYSSLTFSDQGDDEQKIGSIFTVAPHGIDGCGNLTLCKSCGTNRETQLLPTPTSVYIKPTATNKNAF